MCRTRMLGLVVALAVLGAGGPADAAPLCRLIEDPAGDAKIQYQDPPAELYPHTLDIRSADFATDATRLTVVIRLTELMETDSRSPGGLGYEARFSTPTAHFLMLADRVVWDRADEARSLEDRVAVWRVSGPPPRGGTGAQTGTRLDGSGYVVFDDDLAEVRMTVPFEVLAQHAVVKRGTRLSNLSVGSSHKFHAGVGHGGLPSDDAWTDRAYVAGTRTCVRVGE